MINRLKRTPFAGALIDAALYTSPVFLSIKHELIQSDHLYTASLCDTYDQKSVHKNSCDHGCDVDETVAVHHKASEILVTFKLNGVLSIFLSNVVGEGGSHAQSQFSNTNSRSSMISRLKRTPFAGALMLAGLVYFTSFLINESSELIQSDHLYTASLYDTYDQKSVHKNSCDHIWMLTLMTLLESITKHHTYLVTFKLNGVLSIFLSNVVGEGGSHGVF